MDKSYGPGSPDQRAEAFKSVRDDEGAVIYLIPEGRDNHSTEAGE